MGAGSPGPGLREAAGPAPLSFYELQREAKFPQPPNETESKSKLIENRREGEDGWGGAGATAGVGSCVRGLVCKDACVSVIGLNIQECGLRSSGQVHTCSHAGAMCVHCGGLSCTGVGSCLPPLLPYPGSHPSPGPG